MADEATEALEAVVALYEQYYQEGADASRTIGFPARLIISFLCGIPVDTDRQEAAVRDQLSLFEIAVRLTTLERRSSGALHLRGEDIFKRYNSVGSSKELRTLLAADARRCLHACRHNEPGNNFSVTEGVDIGARHFAATHRRSKAIGRYLTADFDVDELLWVKVLTERTAKQSKDVQAVLDSIFPIVQLWCTIFIDVMQTAFDYRHFVPVYSGRRGAHVYVLDDHAFGATDATRSALASFLALQPRKGCDALLRCSEHPEVLRVYETHLRAAFYDIFLEQIDPFSLAGCELRDHIIDDVFLPYMLKSKHINAFRARIRTLWEDAAVCGQHKVSGVSLSTYCFTVLQVEVLGAMAEVEGAAVKPKWHEKNPDMLQWPRVEREIIEGLLYPRLDANHRPSVAYAVYATQENRQASDAVRDREAIRATSLPGAARRGRGHAHGGHEAQTAGSSRRGLRTGRRGHAQGNCGLTRAGRRRVAACASTGSRDSP